MEGKGNLDALSPLELDFLEEFAKRLGVFLERHLLVLRLVAQLEEVHRMGEEMERSESFEAEIIEAAEHKLRAFAAALAGMTE